MAHYRRWRGTVGSFDPLSIGWSLYLRADLGITLDGVTGNVAAWADQTANLNHQIAPAVINQPTYVASDPTFNNRATVNSDALNITIRRAVMALGVANLPAFSFAIVGRHNVAGNNTVLSNYEAASSIRTRSVNTGPFNGFMTGFSTNSTSAWRPNNRSLMYIWDGANQIVKVNNVQEGTAPNASIAQANGMAHSLFATTVGLGPIAATLAEYRFAPFALTPAQQLAIWTYDQARYAL